MFRKLDILPPVTAVVFFTTLDDEQIPNTQQSRVFNNFLG
jgi:hypothetical protein